MSSSTPINRRSLFRMGAGVGLGLAAAPLLAACGDGGTTAKAEAKSAALLPNTAVRNIGLEPDLQGTAAGVPQGFFSYPAKPLRATKGTPLGGAKPISATMETFSPPPPARGKNAAWQQIEKLLGGQVDITAVPADDYGTKFSTMVASDSLPDLFMYPESGGVDNKAAFLQAKCADLTPFLAGDKIKDYPNLAAIPKGAWQAAVFGGKLYGLPIARTGTGGAGFYRHDLFEEVGVSSLDQITGLDRFVELCKELTRPKKDQYAIIAGLTNVLAMSAGAPSYWRLDATTGKFTSDLETPEFRKAVETARELYKAGCFYPGTLQMSGAQKAQYTDMFKNGKGAYVYDGMPSYLAPGVGYVAAMKAIDKKYDPRPFVPVGKDAIAWMDNIALQNTHQEGLGRPRPADPRTRRLRRLAVRQRGVHADQLRRRGNRLHPRRQGQPGPHQAGHPGRHRAVEVHGVRRPRDLQRRLRAGRTPCPRRVHQDDPDDGAGPDPSVLLAHLGLQGVRQPLHAEAGRAEGHHRRPQAPVRLRPAGQGLPGQGRRAGPW